MMRVCEEQYKEFGMINIHFYFEINSKKFPETSQWNI